MSDTKLNRHQYTIQLAPGEVLKVKRADGSRERYWVDNKGRAAIHFANAKKPKAEPTSTQARDKLAECDPNLDARGVAYYNECAVFDAPGLRLTQNPRCSGKSWHVPVVPIRPMRPIRSRLQCAADVYVSDAMIELRREQLNTGTGTGIHLDSMVQESREQRLINLPHRALESFNVPPPMKESDLDELVKRSIDWIIKPQYELGDAEKLVMSGMSTSGMSTSGMSIEEQTYETAAEGQRDSTHEYNEPLESPAEQFERTLALRREVRKLVGE